MFNKSNHLKEESLINNGNKRHPLMAQDNNIGNENFYSCDDDENEAFESIDSNHLSSTKYPGLQKRRRLSPKKTNCDNSNNDNKNRTESHSNNQQDLVIYTSINANHLKVCRVSCITCAHSSQNIYQDAQFYLNILQFFIVNCVLILIGVNIFTMNRIFTIDYIPCYLENCHLNFVLVSLSIINILMMLMIYYDGCQCRKGSLRLNDWLFLVLLWAGGWPSAWFALYMLNYRSYYKEKAILLRKTQTVASALGISTLVTYLFWNAKN